jgi:hydrogenase maturation protease
VSGAPSGPHVVCFGNPWHGDDGFGHHVFLRLRELRPLPSDVELFDVGVAGLNALPCVENCAKAVMVDAVRVGAPLGSVHRLLRGDLEPPGGVVSLHELGLTSLLEALSVLSSDAPEVVVIGAQIGAIRTFTDELSPPLRAAVPAAVDLVVRECSA